MLAFCDPTAKEAAFSSVVLSSCGSPVMSGPRKFKPADSPRLGVQQLGLPSLWLFDPEQDAPPPFSLCVLICKAGKVAPTLCKWQCREDSDDEDPDVMFPSVDSMTRHVCQLCCEKILCSHHHHPSLELFPSCKTGTVPVRHSFPIPLLPAPVNHPSSFCFYEFNSSR